MIGLLLYFILWKWVKLYEDSAFTISMLIDIFIMSSGIVLAFNGYPVLGIIIIIFSTPPFGM